MEFNPCLSTSLSRIPPTISYSVIEWLVRGMKCILSKFVDNARLRGAVHLLEGRAAHQRDLDRLEQWAYRYLLKLNKSTCTVLHLGWNNARQQYRLGASCLGSSSAERNLWSRWAVSWKWASRCQTQTKHIPGYIFKSAVSRPRKVIFPLYSALPGLHLECHIQFWAPQCRKDTDVLQQVYQRPPRC